MTLHALTVPDDPAELPGWLEGRLLAPDFGQFLAELQAFFPPSPAPASLRNALDACVPTALTEGLAAVPRDVLLQLLKTPALLAAFQERVATDGGPYWDDVAERSDGLARGEARGRAALDGILTAAAPAPARVKDSATVVPAARRQRPAGRGYKAWAIASTAVAAGLAVAVGGLLLSGPEEPPVMKSQIAWGWGKPGGLANLQTRPRDYLNKLADNAEEWTLYRPADADGVGARIAELRTGCTRLMHSPYGPLAAADKEWLLQHCRGWAKALDAHQQALDGGADPVAVRAQVDETVRTIAATLREKAKQLG